jgi:hypothetical protein
MLALRVSAADTNLNQSITVERPLDDVVRAMQTYYFSTNLSVVCSTNAVPGVSYSLGIADCNFSGSLFAGEMVATHVTASSTRLEFTVRAVSTPAPKDLGEVSVKQNILRTLERVAQIAKDTR